MPFATRPSLDMMALLHGVSRSFYLSIRVLPGPLRAPVAIGYLLARAADTLADTGRLSTAQRHTSLTTWTAAIGEFPTREAPRIAEELALSCAPLQDDLRERDLIAALPKCLLWLDSLPAQDAYDVRRVIRLIASGQLKDIERFPQGEGLKALATREQLEDYTYLVAGSVGEFWTDLCVRHLPEFAPLPHHRMRELGRAYGQALQLVNILRDVPADLAAGRCYLPLDALLEGGLEPEDILSRPERFESVSHEWHVRAWRGIEDGMRYAAAVNSRRVRAASALPALLAARTLSLLEAAGARRLESRVKMPRAEVRAVAFRLAITLAARRPLQSLFRQLHAGWSGIQWDNRAP